MKLNERMKKVLSVLLCTLMLVQYVPTFAFAAAKAEDGLCQHHTAHTDDCGYVEGEGGCIYRCDICLVHDQAEELPEPSAEPAPVCDCGNEEDDTTYTANFDAEWAAIVTEAPTANALTYTGSAQELVTGGTASGGEMQYSPDGQNWSTAIPTGTNAGTYTVYYKALGDSNHSDSAVRSVDVCIAKAVASVVTAPEAIADLVYNGSNQQLVTEGAAEGGTMMYNALNSYDRSFTEQLPTGKYAREYYVYYYVKGDANHEDSEKQVVKVTIAHAEIDRIDVTIAAPVAGEVPQGTVYYDGLYYARPDWSPAADTFDFNTVYSVTVAVVPKNSNGHMFSEEAYEDFRAQMEADGWTVWGSQKSMTLIKTFEATRKAEVNITAEEQTILYGQTIAADAYSVVSEVEGLTVSAVLNANTANVTADGTITVSDVVIFADGVNVTDNYTIRCGEPAKLVIKPDTAKIDGLTTENVTSANRGDIETVRAMMENADSIMEEWQAISATCGKLLEKIEAVEDEIARIAEAVAGYDLTSVKSSDKAALEQLARDIEALLNTRNLTEDERAALETLLDQVNGRIHAIKDTVPETGDDSHIMLWFGVLCASALWLAVLLPDRRRRKATK